ncbi:TPA: hypothetical protein ACFP3Z_000859 [Neisseria subflava]
MNIVFLIVVLLTIFAVAVALALLVLLCVRLSRMGGNAKRI